MPREADRRGLLSRLAEPGQRALRLPRPRLRRGAARLRAGRARAPADGRGWPAVEAIVITHFHLDHWGDLVPWVWGALYLKARDHALPRPHVWVPPTGRAQLERSASCSASPTCSIACSRSPSTSRGCRSWPRATRSRRRGCRTTRSTRTRLGSRRRPHARLSGDAGPAPRRRSGARSRPLPLRGDAGPRRPRRAAARASVARGGRGGVRGVGCARRCWSRIGRRSCRCRTTTCSRSTACDRVCRSRPDGPADRYSACPGGERRRSCSSSRAGRRRPGSRAMVLSKATDALDVRLGLGEELGGLLLLALAGSLPEVAITVSAAAGGHLGLAAGNLIGGIAVQTMVLLICDVVAGDIAAHVPRRRADAGARGAARDDRRLRGADGGAAEAVDRDRRSRQPGLGRDLRRLGHRALRDQPGAQGAALARLDAGEQAGPKAPPRVRCPTSRIRTRRTRPAASL